MPCDIIFSPKASATINNCNDDSIFVVNSENRSANALNVILDGEKIIDSDLMFDSKEFLAGKILQIGKKTSLRFEE